MPGVPKSQGCQSCKLRKIKCDETWPCCSHCETSRLVCPGPTQLFKFVHNSVQVTGKKKQLRASAPKEHGAAGAWHNLQLRKTHHHPIVYVEERGIVDLSLSPSPSPKSISSTADELASMRLVSHLDGRLESITHLGLTFLLHVPTRITGSECLKDSVELFCSGLADFQCPHPKGDLMQLPHYGKALRSLRLALMGDEALKTETLAAVFLMERASNLFDRQGLYINIHSRAAIQMIKQKGPTKTDDQLVVAVTHDVYGLSMFGWTVKGGNGYAKPKAWKKALDKVRSTHEKISSGGSFGFEDFETIVECCRNLNALIPEFQSALRHPSKSPTQMGSTTGIEQIRDLEEIMTKAVLRLVENAIEHGTMTLIADPDSITGNRYEFTNPQLCQLYLVLLFLQLVPLHVMYELSLIQDKPDESLHARLRLVAIEVWKCTPYINSTGRMAGMFPAAPLFATYEVADAREKEYILDMAQRLDKYCGRLPATRAAQREFILKHAKILMGRDSESSYF